MDRKIETVVTDLRLEWPDTFSEGLNGLYLQFGLAPQ
jgi:hypothetical protein